MGRRVLIDELMKTTFRYYFFFASFMAKTSLISGQRRRPLSMEHVTGISAYQDEQNPTIRISS